MTPHFIVHVNAGLNAMAAILLVIGYLLIKQRRETAHKWVMISSLIVSMAFLMCYLWYHYQVGSVSFTHPGVIRTIYLTILASHVLLAMTVPVLALWTIYLGFRATGCCMPEGDPMAMKDYRAKHRRVAHWTYPIWMYVSITGVVVYLMLYHLWPPAGP